MCRRPPADAVRPRRAWPAPWPRTSRRSATSRPRCCRPSVEATADVRARAPTGVLAGTAVRRRGVPPGRRRRSSVELVGRRRRPLVDAGTASARVARAAGADPHGRAHRAQLPRPPVRHRHAHAPRSSTPSPTRAASLRVWDTRKTTPGLRALEKAAVRAGGGVEPPRQPVRLGACSRTTTSRVLGIADAVRPGPGPLAGPHGARRVRRRSTRCARRVEAGADALLLDNMAPDEVRAVVADGRGRWRRPAPAAARDARAAITLENDRAATRRPAPTWCRSARSPTRPRCSTSASTSCPG